jgi:hypothetical protein
MTLAFDAPALVGARFLGVSSRVLSPTNAGAGILKFIMSLTPGDNPPKIANDK